MTDRLRIPEEELSSGYDPSLAMQQKVLELLGEDVGDARAERVRQLVHLRFEEVRDQASGPFAPAPRLSPVWQPFAEPGTVADRLNLIEAMLDQREDVMRGVGEAITCLAEEVKLLKRRNGELEGRIAALEGA
jgi:hypothetical protein